MSLLMMLRFIPAFAIELTLALGRWLIERPVRLVILALMLLSAWLWFARDHARDLAADRRAQADAWHGKFVTQKSEMLKLVALVRAARAEAARQDQANIQRVQDQWTIHVAEMTNAYQADLAAARALIGQRLRAPARPGGVTGADRDGGEAGLSTFPTLSTGPVRPGQAAIVDEPDIDACTVNSVRLWHLIGAWERAASIDPSSAGSNPR